VCCSGLQCVATNLTRHGNTLRQSLVLLQCVAACGGVLRCVAVCCHESDESWHHFAAVSLEMRVCCNMLQCVVVCCGVLWCVAGCCSVSAPVSEEVRLCCSVLRCVAVCCSVLQ